MCVVEPVCIYTENLSTILPPFLSVKKTVAMV